MEHRFAGRYRIRIHHYNKGQPVLAFVHQKISRLIPPQLFGCILHAIKSLEVIVNFLKYIENIIVIYGDTWYN